MKTKKVKGFTLIELIVVIAIIGVLAAILVPSMLGYVKKSKIQNANSAAATYLKACNSALTELDELDYVYNGTSITITGNSAAKITDGVADAAELFDYMKAYADISATTLVKIEIRDGVAVAAAAKSGKYFGTSPSSFTNKTYDKIVKGDTDDAKLTAAFKAAVDKYAEKHPESSNSGGTNTPPADTPAQES